MDQPAEVTILTRIVVLARNPDRLRNTTTFLNRRDLPCVVATSLNDAVEKISKQEANLLLLSVNFQHPKVEMIPALIGQSFNIETMVFAEDQDRKSSQKLQQCKTKHIIQGGLSGPIVLMRVRAMEKAANATEEDNSEEGKARAKATNEEGGRIAISGKKSKDEKVVLKSSKGGAGANGEDEQGGMVKSLDADGNAIAIKGSSSDLGGGKLLKGEGFESADSEQGEGSLASKGETFVAKGNKLNMGSEQFDGDLTAQLAATEEGLSASAADMLRQAAEAAKTAEKKPKKGKKAKRKNRLGTSGEEEDVDDESGEFFASQEDGEDEADDDNTDDNDVDADEESTPPLEAEAPENESPEEAAKRAEEFQNALANFNAEKERKKQEAEEKREKARAEKEARQQAAKEQKLKQEEEKAERKEREAQERARREKEKEEKEEKAADAAEKTAREKVEKEKTAREKTERDKAEIEKKTKEAKVRDPKEKPERKKKDVFLDEGDDEESEKELEDEEPSEEETEAEGAEAQLHEQEEDAGGESEVHDAEGAADGKAVEPGETDPEEASAEGEPELHENEPTLEMAEETPEEAVQDEANSPEEEKTEEELRAEMAAAQAAKIIQPPVNPLAVLPPNLTQEQNVYWRCMDLALRDICGDQCKSVPQISKTQSFEALIVNAGRLKGTFVFGLVGTPERPAPALGEKLRERLKHHFTENQIKIEPMDTFLLPMNTGAFEQSLIPDLPLAIAYQGSEMEATIGYLEEMELAPPVDSSFEDKREITLTSLADRDLLNFSIYIYMPANKKFIRYWKPDSTIRQRQLDRLTAFQISTVYITSTDVTRYKEFCANKTIKEIVKKRKNAFDKKAA